MELTNYHISSLADLKDMPDAQLVQILMPSLHPSKCNVLKELESYRDACKGVDLLYHYSLVYTASRYALCNASTRKAMVSQLYTLMTYDSPSLVGIVIHTDFPICKEVVEDRSKLESHYSGNLWDVQRITDSLSSGDPVEWSISQLYDDLRSLNASMPSSLKRKVYLEGAAKVGPSGQCSVGYLIDLITRNGWGDFFGVCIDTEHEYAATGLDYTDTMTFRDAMEAVDVVCHLNAIPSGVRPCGGRDRHSETSLFECSVRDMPSYTRFVNFLNEYGIPYVRECSQEVRLREQTQLRMYTIDSHEPLPEGCLFP